MGDGIEMSDRIQMSDICGDKSARNSQSHKHPIEVPELAPSEYCDEIPSIEVFDEKKSITLENRKCIQVNILLNSICIGWLQIFQPDKMRLCEFRTLIKNDIGKLGYYAFLCHGAPCSAAQEVALCLDSILTEPQDNIFASKDHVKVKVKIVRLIKRIKLSKQDNDASSEGENSADSMGLAIMGFDESEMESIKPKSPGHFKQKSNHDVISLIKLETNEMRFVIPPPSLPESTVIIVHKEKQVFNLLQLSRFLLETPITYNRENPCWVDIEGEPIVFRACLTLFPPIHPLTYEDVIMDDTREKIEWFDDYMLLILRIPDVENPKQTKKVSIIVFSDSLIATYHKTAFESLSDMRKKIKRRHLKDKYVTYSCPDPAWVVYGIFDGIVDALLPLVSKIGKRVGEIERRVLTESEPDDQFLLLQKIQKSRAFLTDLRQVLLPKFSIASNVMANVQSVDWMSAVPLPWWTDCQDHIAGMKDKLEVGNSDLESLQNVFLAKVSLNITMKSHHLNELASKLGTLATVLLPLTFLTGLFGMNVQVPWQTEDSLRPFAALCTFMFVLVVVLMIFFKLKKWL